MKRSEHILYSNSPARLFNEAYPIGNGKLGAMVYGDPAEMRFGLNHDELWVGYEYENGVCYNKEDYLEAQRLALSGDYLASQKKLEADIAIANGGGYLTLGDLFISFQGKVENYRRELNIKDSVSTVSFTLDGTPVSVEAIASFPKNVLAFYVKSETPVSFSARFRVEMEAARIVSGSRISVFGECPTLCERQEKFPKTNVNVENHSGIRFATAMDFVTDGVASDLSGSFGFEGSKETLILISAETSYKDGRVLGCENYKELLTSYLDGAKKESYADIKCEHIADVSELYGRVDVTFESCAPEEELETWERVKKFAEGSSDMALPVLQFNFGRYLLIAASREGSRATTLQGIWNEKMHAPWYSNYTTNINTEMNYWPVLPCAMPELLSPLDSLVRLLSETGRSTAKHLFGAEGFTANHNADIFGYSHPAGGQACWSYFPVSAAWLMRELYNKYEYTGDKEYLASILPLHEEAARFFLDVLIDDGDYLIMCPGTSAENHYRLDSENICSVGRSSTVFASIVRECFTHLVSAAEILGYESDVVTRVKSALPKLLPLRITDDGRIEEWYFGGESKSPEESEIHHRHISHLYDLYPGNLINPDEAELFAAARESLRVRGDDATGWSLGWKMNCYARLHDGDGVMRLARMFLRPVAPDNERNLYGGGVYPNLFCAHPPFQIDGNYGYTAGICEMLVSGSADKPSVLPALPKEFGTGHAKGIALRGGKRADLEWRDGKVTKFELY